LASARDNDDVVSQHNCAIVFLLISLPAFPQQKEKYDFKKCDSAPSLAFAQAEQMVVEKGSVEIPPLAKSIRLQGVVRIEVCVSEAGEVVLTKPVSGQPILIPAAIDSAKKWRFKPGQAGVAFKTILEISFSQGSTPAQIAGEQKINDEFFAEERKCRESVGGKNLDSALKICKEAVDLVERLPKERVNERMGAYQLVGHVYFAQQKFEEALRYYKMELEIGLTTLRPTDAELAYAYHHVAMACHGLGRVSDAVQNYAMAEQTMSQAGDHIGLDELKPKYAATLKEIREHYLILLRQTNQVTAAADLERRIQSERK
jgi:tetratricopeptide (TPR) repeat protein